MSSQTSGLDETGAPEAHPAAPTILSIPMALVKAIRPKQATKNLIVFAAIVFANQLTDLHKLKLVVLTFLLYCAVSGSIYLLNDILDVEQDRQHPKKRFRPIASGALPVPIAWAAFAILSFGGIAASTALKPLLGLTVGVYVALQVAYCLELKHVVLLDVFSIAFGFVLRAVGGGVVIGLHISHWLLLCTLMLALFMGFGKRRQELVLLGRQAGLHRAILDEYSLPFLDTLITIVTGVTIVCYSVYSIQSETAILHPHLWLTVPFVFYSICRYLYLVFQKGWGGAPEDVLAKDRSLQVAMVLWFITVIALFRFDLLQP
jgi:4-hydroxybenzoate polyprenyltransferase